MLVFSTGIDRGFVESTPETSRAPLWQTGHGRAPLRGHVELVGEQRRPLLHRHPSDAGSNTAYIPRSLLGPFEEAQRRPYQDLQAHQRGKTLV